MLDRMSGLAKDQTITPEEKAQMFDELLGTVMNPEQVRKQATTPQMVKVTGYIKPYDNGNLKMFVTDNQGLPVPEHQNIWVNDGFQHTMQSNPDGSVTLTIDPKALNGNVTYPLGPQDFSELRQKGQAPLPDREAGVKPTEVPQVEKSPFVSEPTTQPVTTQTTNVAPTQNVVRQPFPKLDPDVLRARTQAINTENGVIYNAGGQDFVGDPGTFGNLGDSVRLQDGSYLSHDLVDSVKTSSGKVLWNRTKPSPFDSGEQTVMKEAGVEPTQITQPESVKVAIHQIETAHAIVADAQEKLDVVPKGVEDVTNLVTATPNPNKYSPAVKFEDGRVESIASGDYEHPMLGHEELLQDINEGKTIRGYQTNDGRFLSLMEVAREEMEAQQKEGATPTQAVESVRLQTQTPLDRDWETITRGSGVV